MVQLLNLVVHNVAAPALHNSGFAVSLDAPPHTCQNFPCARYLKFIELCLLEIAESLCSENNFEWKNLYQILKLKKQGKSTNIDHTCSLQLILNRISEILLGSAV